MRPWLIFFILVLPIRILAQLAEPTSYLMGPISTPARDSGETKNSDSAVRAEPRFESSRYTVRPGATPRSQKRSENLLIATPPGETPAAPEVSLESKGSQTRIKEPKQSLPTPVQAQGPGQAADVAPADEPARSSALIEAEPEADDFRLNIIDIGLAAGFLSNRSDSIYSFRRYATASPLMVVNADIWPRPDWGFTLDYSASMNADLENLATTQSELPAVHQRLGGGIQSRQMFSYDQHSPLLMYGLYYSDYRLSVPLNAIERGRLRTTGLSFRVNLYTPTEKGTFWEWGVELSPNLHHQEESTMLTLRSGQSVETASIAMQMGSHYRLSKGQEFFWRMRAVFEKNHFRGVAAVTDPLSGAIPENISVENLFVYWVMGVTWGQ